MDMKRRYLGLGAATVLVLGGGLLVWHAVTPADADTAGRRAALTPKATSVGGCTPSAHPPWVSGGYAYANVYVRCGSTPRTVVVQAQIWEEDPASSDDLVKNWQGSDTTVQAGQTVRFGPISGWCRGKDAAGNEELYAKARVWVNNIWSDFHRSQIISINC